MQQITLLILLFPAVLTDFHLNIYHTNDIHARYNGRGATEAGLCKEGDTCYGGMPRHATFFKEHVDTTANNLILNAGDWFTGTTYFTVYQGAMAAKYLNQFKYDAWSLGNHEFDRGAETLANMIDLLNDTTVTLAANMKVTPNSALDGKVKPSTIKEFILANNKTVKVGIVGYIVTETSYLSKPGPDVTFTDIKTAVEEEVSRLQAQGVDIIIALGHAGHETDKAICQDITGVDIVVGGHSNTFLYNGNPPEGAVVKEPIEGPYPVTFRNDKCLVVQDFAYGKFMGNLSVTFDDAGMISSYSGNPVLLWGEDYPEDNDTLAKLAAFSEEVDKYGKIVVGYTETELQGSRHVCRHKECQLGNIMADAYLNAYREADAETVCAIINSGSIRSGLDKGNITYEDIMTIMPFGNTVDRAALPGSDILRAFEHSVSTFNSSKVNVGEEGRYLQVAGIRVHYQLKNKVGSRVTKLEIMNKSGEYEDLRSDKTYYCAVNNYMLAGGDAFHSLKGHQVTTGDVDVDVLQKFVKDHNPLNAYEGIQDIPARSFISKGKCIGVTLNILLFCISYILLLL